MTISTKTILRPGREVCITLFDEPEDECEVGVISAVDAWGVWIIRYGSEECMFPWNAIKRISHDYEVKVPTLEAE